MADIPRLNGVIKVLSEGKPAFTCFAAPEVGEAIQLSQSKFDGVVFEMEHGPWDIRALRDALQYMLNRRQMVTGGTLAPAVTPIVRIPPNGGEKSQWHAKQALDLGVYGIVWPHVTTVDQAYNAVAACRYPRLPNKPRFEPQGIRGDAPGAAARYWGLQQQEYYARADVWPLAPDGEILVILMIEDTLAIKNLDAILGSVPGIGVCLIGEGDLSQELGCARQYDHPDWLGAMTEVRAICKKHNVAVGHPHVDAQNVERVLKEGYTFLMPAPTRSYAGLEKGLQLAGRK
jgi:4-hydroxy-2-oxoheptanedioate aldolase